MIINVQAKKGVVVESPQTAYNVGDIKWNDIVAQDKKNYRYEELGSDGGYYLGSMVFGIDDRLRISAAAQPDDGYLQKWVR